MVGVIQLLENDVAQITYHCQYINEDTGWKPSCTSSAPASDFCDCDEHNCVANFEVLYCNRQCWIDYLKSTLSKFFFWFCFVAYASLRFQVGNKYGEPQEIKCVNLSFFDAFYFIVVTTATVGYGDIAPTTTWVLLHCCSFWDSMTISMCSDVNVSFVFLNL